MDSIWRCHTRTNLELLVTGDRVKWQADPNTGLGIITAIYPRQSLLTRPDRYHKLNLWQTLVDCDCICAITRTCSNID
jgi:ribosome biogenesis GTPase